MSTSVEPLVAQANAAAGSGGSVVGTVVGGAAANGEVQTRGPAGEAVKLVMPASCGSVSGIDATGTGVCSKAQADGATAYGSNASATAENTTAIGFRAAATYAGSVAIGYNARATADPTTAIGSNALASGNNAVALGADAQATAANSVALGTGSVASEDNTVSVGAQGAERRITNVSAGINPTDAVNVGQLRDAISGVQNQINDVARNAYSGVAAATALTMIPEVDPGKTLSFGIGAASFHGYQAVALGGTARITQNLKVKAGVGISGASTAFGAGAAYQW